MFLIPGNISNDEKDQDECCTFSAKGNKNKETCEDEKTNISITDACVLGIFSILQEHLTSHDINDFVSNGWTPLTVAASAANVKVVEYLLRNGADPNKHGGGGNTALMLLCMNELVSKEICLQCLRSLIDANANVDAIDNYKRTALLYACVYQEKEFVLELLQHVKNINAQDSWGNTALIYAVRHNRSDIVEVLIENKADTTIKDKNYLTASDIANIKEYKVIYDVLNPHKDDTTLSCETLQTECFSNQLEWNDMFPTLATNNRNITHSDVSAMLAGMNLDMYVNNFRGIDIKTFLQLTEEDLMRLGVTISVHKKQFAECLQKFHAKKWSLKSIGVIDKSTPYTIYDGIVSLGIIAKQVGVICAGYHYIIKNIEKQVDKDVYFNSAKSIEYKSESADIRVALCNIKKNLLLLKKLARKIDKENNIGVPATFIGPRKCNNWFAVITITVTIGVLLLKKGNLNR